MILAEIRDYLATRGRAPLSDLATRFAADPEAMRAMLDQWIRKGRVRRLDDGSGACGCCCGCTDKLPEVYEWISPR